MYLLTVLHLASFTLQTQTIRQGWLNTFCLRTTWWKKVYLYYIYCMYFLKFIFLNEEPSFQYNSITKKRELIIIKNKESPFCILWINSTLWNMFNISIHETPINRKGKEKWKNIHFTTFQNSCNITKYF